MEDTIIFLFEMSLFIACIQPEAFEKVSIEFSCCLNGIISEIPLASITYHVFPATSVSNVTTNPNTGKSYDKPQNTAQV